MTEPELREKVAHIVCGNAKCFGRCMYYDGRDTPCRSKTPDQIHTLYEEAGWRKVEVKDGS